MKIIYIGISVIMTILLSCQSKDNKTENIAPEGWIALFDGKSLTGWKTNENPETFKVADGMIVAEGEKSHLFYTGPVQNANFKNFEFEADFKTEPGANSGIFFHTVFDYSNSPQNGYEVQISNESGKDPKTGSLYNIVNFSDSPVGNGKWFNLYIKVQEKSIMVKINDVIRFKYDEEKDAQAAERTGRKISSGTFALQHWNPKSRVYIKNIFVRPIE